MDQPLYHKIEQILDELLCDSDNQADYDRSSDRGAFLLPYLIMLFVLGIPLFYLELSLGQSLALGPIGAWLRVTPNLGGVGIAAIVVIVYFCLYYNVIIGWVIFYFVNSFHAILPWAECWGHDVTNGLSQNETEEILTNFTGNVYALERCINESTE